jgi:FkbM family methyltransferase
VFSIIPESLRYPVVNLWNEESNRGQRTRRLLTFFGWQLWKRTIRKPVTVSLFNGRKFIAYPDCSVSSGILYTRIPNSRNIIFLRQHLSGGTLVDIGANVGSVSLLLADKVEDAILFEPNPLAAARARENIALNNLHFRLFEIALSDSNGEVCFESRGGVDATAHVVAASRDPEGVRHAVQCMTFDEFLRGHGPLRSPISLVKIDVEGHENGVFRGMRQFLRTQRPPLVMFEYLQRTNIRETLDFLREVEYLAFELGKNRPIPVTAQVEPLQDLFACPLELVPTFGVADAA